MNSRTIKRVAPALLLALPLAAWAQSHGGGPPAGVGGGLGGSVSGAVGGGHGGGVAGGMAGGVAGGAGVGATGGTASRAGDVSSLSDSGLSKAEAHRLEIKAKREAAALKAAEAHANGAANANGNAAFGQATAAQARTLKDADVDTRKAFHETVVAGAKLQGKGDATGEEDDDDADDADDADDDGDASAEVSARVDASASGTQKARTAKAGRRPSR